MTINSPTPPRHPAAAKLALVSTVSFGLLAGPIAFAGPASASQDQGRNDTKNCYVKAFPPKKADNDRKDRDHGKYGKSVKVVFTFKIVCKKGTWVHFNHRMFQNNGHRELLKRDRNWVWVHGGEHRGQYFDHTVRVYPDRGEKIVHVSHVVRIRFLAKDRYNGWKWETHRDSAHAYIEVDKKRPH